jgi:juvenile hormone epoxide hydrolase
LSDVELTHTFPDQYWGPPGTQNEKEDITIKPFKISVEEKVVTNLKRKLKEELESGRFTPPLEGIGFEYGFNSKYLKEVTTYWLNKYDWRSREKLLNQFPSFKTKISGLNIHFQQVKSKNNGKYKKTRPLLVLHGWPGSFVEHQKFIPLLTDPVNSDINFEVIVPSLPGYGFSDGATRPGLGVIEMGQIFVKLMRRLGHEKFYIQGGDWGSVIGSTMAMIYPKNVVGYHSNGCISNHPRAILRMLGATFFPSYLFTGQEAERFAPLSKVWTFWTRETGYLHIQATKPDTIGAALSQSPTGLAAYILEKFSTWTNEKGMHSLDGALTNKFGMDELLDNIMVYWVSNTITTSVRLYSEFFGKRFFGLGLDRVPVKVPTACIVSWNDGYTMQTESMVAETFHNLISYKYAADGGHFLAMEHPDVLANDVLPFVKIVEEKYNPF